MATDQKYDMRQEAIAAGLARPKGNKGPKAMFPQNPLAVRYMEKRAKVILACSHSDTVAAPVGYAMCNVCGALLPDEDPDLKSKCE